MPYSFNHFKDHIKAWVLASVPKHKRILDVGCSTGTAAANIFDLAETDYSGIDSFSSFICYWRKIFVNLTSDFGKFSFIETKRFIYFSINFSF